MIRFQSLFFSKYLSVTRLFSCLQLPELSQQPQLWYYYVFKVNFEEGLIPPNFFWGVASSEALIQRCSLMKYGTLIKFSFKIAILNIFGKLLEKYQRQSSYSAYLWAFNMSCRKWFSRNFLKISRTTFSKNTTGGMLLISCDCSLKIFRTFFEECLVVTKDHTYLSKT